MSAKKHEKTLQRSLRFIDELSANPKIRFLVYSISLVFFIIVIFIPPILGIVLRWDLIGQVFDQPTLMARARSAIAASFSIAFLVATIDLVAALPMAWLIVRRKPKWVNVIDTLADIPFVIPTVALGYSTLLFWSGSTGVSRLFRVESLVSPGLILIILLHFAFSYPIIVRLMVGELQGYEEVYEIAAKTLGASSFTAVRTVTFPLLKPALVSSFLLAFSRSLSETGATIMVAGTFENGSIFIRNAKSAGLEGPLVFVSFILIFVSCLIFFVISFLGPKLKLPIKRVWPNVEKELSRPKFSTLRDGLTLLIFFIFVAAPSLFIALPGIAAMFDGTFVMALSGTGVWSQFWGSLVTSYVIGFTATLVNLLAGFPIAIIIARKKIGVLNSSLLDTLINIPVIIPSVALGVSLSFFWSVFGALPEFWVLVLVHTTITYTYFTRTMAAAIEGVPEELEEVARTLGGRPFQAFRRIILPLTKYSIFSGAIMVFTRSVDETGATVAVSKTIKTAPVLLVDWVTGKVAVTQSEIGLGLMFLVLTSFLSLLVVRLFLRRKG